MSPDGELEWVVVLWHSCYDTFCIWAMGCGYGAAMSVLRELRCSRS